MRERVQQAGLRFFIQAGFGWSHGPPCRHSACPHALVQRQSCESVCINRKVSRQSAHASNADTPVHMYKLLLKHGYLHRLPLQLYVEPMYNHKSVFIITPKAMIRIRIGIRNHLMSHRRGNLFVTAISGYYKNDTKVPDSPVVCSILQQQLIFFFFLVKNYKQYQNTLQRASTNPDGPVDRSTALCNLYRKNFLYY